MAYMSNWYVVNNHSLGAFIFGVTLNNKGCWEVWLNE